MDLIKFFKRQKSVNKTAQSCDSDDFSDYQINDNNNVFESTNVSADSRSTNDSVTNHSHDMVDATDFTQSFNESSQSRPESVFVKEPKGWRKSFRKLRRKKKGDIVSSSYDNIIKRSDTTIADSKLKIENPNANFVSKRWSYSPDLNEETVPGAKELRGRLESKLSVKAEEKSDNFSTPPESPHFSHVSPPPRLVSTSTITPSNQSNSQYYDPLNKSLDLDQTLINTTETDPDNTPMNSPLVKGFDINEPYISNSLSDLHAEKKSSVEKLYKSNPSLELQPGATTTNNHKRNTQSSKFYYLNLLLLPSFVYIRFIT